MWEFFFSIETQLCSSSNIFLMLIIFIFACFAKTTVTFLTLTMLDKVVALF